MPNLSESVRAVVATMGESEELELSSEAVESAPGDPGRLLFLPSFLMRVSSGGSNVFSLVFLATFGGGGFTPDTSITSPDRLRGLGGGGCLLGSVGLSDELVLTGLRFGGGVVGLGILLVGGDGDGDGGRGLGRGLGGGEAALVGFVTLERGTENDLDLDRCLL